MSSVGTRTLREALAEATQTLVAAGVPSPRFDAEELACFVLDVARTQLAGRLAGPVPPDYPRLVALRAERVPLQHLTGAAHFRTVTLAVGPGVFVPRPETEVVVGHALELLSRWPGDQPVVVDLGSGSGAIAISIATEAPGAVVHAVEADPGAWPWLDRNAVGTGVTVHHADLVDCLPGLTGQVAVVVSNPPYIPDGAVPVDPEVILHDPPRALWSGPEGLDHIAHVERAAARLLRSGGWAVVEHSDQQGRSAPARFASAGGWSDVRDWPDLAGRDRYLTARRAREGEDG